MFVSFDREVTPVWFKLVFAYGGIDVLEMTVILLLPIIIIIIGEEKEGIILINCDVLLYVIINSNNLYTNYCSGSSVSKNNHNCNYT